MPFSRLKVWVANEVLKSSDLNAEFDNVANNFTPQGLDDVSQNASAMQTSTDPGLVGTESLATTLAGEIYRLRYAIKRLVDRTGSKQWYENPTLQQTADIADNAITLAKLPDGVFAASTAARNKFAAGFLTTSMLPAANYGISPSSANFQTNSTGNVDVVSVPSITTTGRPVEILLQPTSNIASWQMSWSGVNTNDYTLVGYLILQRDGITIATFPFNTRVRVTPAITYTYDNNNQVNNPTSTVVVTNLCLPLSTVHFIDYGATAGSHVYKLQARVNATAMNLFLTDSALTAIEK